MEILAIVLAVISFLLCFIIWVIPFVGPLFVIGLSILAIIISIVVMVNVSEYNKRNIFNQDFLPRKNTKAIISAIVSGVSLVIAVIFLILHIFLFINFDTIADTATNITINNEDETRVTEAEYGVAYEIEKDIFLTIENAIYEDGKLYIEYSITNHGNEENVLYLSNFYYNSTSNIDEKIYPYKNTMMPIYIEPNAVYVSEIINIQMEDEPATIGYDSISGESIIINVE